MMIYQLIFLSIFASFALADVEVLQKHPDVGLNAKKLIKKYGYPFEAHSVTTEDGYILELHRIPYGKKTMFRQNKPVAFVVPGILCSSADFVNMGPENSLAFILADRGYDVWIANPRGTTWSKKHTTLNPKKQKKQYWDFSFHEIGKYDLPAKIDYILKTTGQENLFMIGHSQGGTTYFTLLSERPEYNNKVRLMSVLSPVMYVGNTNNVMFKVFSKRVDAVQEYIEKSERYDVLPHTIFNSFLAQRFCNDDSQYQDLCALIFHVIAGYNPEQFNKSMIPVIATNTPAGASSKQIVHYLQLVSTSNFQNFDYGEKENMERYGQPTPALYNITNIQAPTAIFYSDNDLISSQIDAEKIIADLPNVVHQKLVKRFTHLDFLWAIDVVPLLYNDVLSLMDQY